MMRQNQVDLILLTESEIEIVSGQETDYDLQYAPACLKRVVDTTDSSVNIDEEVSDCHGDGRAKKRCKFDHRDLYSQPQSEVTESIQDIIEHVINIAGDSVITVDNIEEESFNDESFLGDYPYLNTFPDLEVDPDEIEENVEEDSQELVNTSTATLKPDFSDLTVKETSELDIILYSDRTSSEYHPDPRHYIREDHPVNFWDAES